MQSIDLIWSLKFTSDSTREETRREESHPVHRVINGTNEEHAILIGSEADAEVVDPLIAASLSLLHSLYFPMRCDEMREETWREETREEESAFTSPRDARNESGRPPGRRCDTCGERGERICRSIHRPAAIGHRSDRCTAQRSAITVQYTKGCEFLDVCNLAIIFAIIAPLQLRAEQEPSADGRKGAL